MKSDINCSRPLIMHIDLNSCFATVEQQSRPTLRHKPVAVVNRAHDNAVIVTASYEAKASGIKTGMRLKTARLLCPSLTAVESDPPKYFHVYRQLLGVLGDYSPEVQMKSIDEGLIDFSCSPREVGERDLLEVGKEIKQRLRQEIGEYMSCNVGIGTNRFLAKTAAGFDKPDGLTLINHRNLRQMYAKLELEDLTGIAGGFGRRLRQLGIGTPLDFLLADRGVLEKQVFKSRVGALWHKRLRGWEVDDVEYSMKTIGRQFVLDGKGLSHAQVLQRFYSLCEDVAFKLRSQGVVAGGARIYVKPSEGGLWKNHTLQERLFDDEKTLFRLVRQMFASAPLPIFEIGVTCYALAPKSQQLMDLFGEAQEATQLAEAVDKINHFWGLRTIHSATTLGAKEAVQTKVPFGSIRFIG